jgi:hypothetical protein
MVIHKLQFLFTKSTVTLYRQWEIEQEQPVQMADTKTNETRNREVNSLYWVVAWNSESAEIYMVRRSFSRRFWQYFFKF